MMDLLHPTDCKFPFTYKGKSYDSCTGDGAKDFTWCAHNKDYTSGNEGVTWEKCPETVPYDQQDMIDYSQNYAYYSSNNITNITCI